jgi:hypothetical protein
MSAEQEPVAKKSDPEAMYHAIGRFIFEFSQLDYAIRHYVGEEAGIKEEQFSAIMTHDFALLCTVATEILSQSFREEDQKRRLRDIIRECRKINDERVRVVHGLWVPFMEGGTVHHVSRSSLRVSMSVDQAKHLEHQADLANHLRGMLEELMWED